MFHLKSTNIIFVKYTGDGNQPVTWRNTCKRSKLINAVHNNCDSLNSIRWCMRKIGSGFVVNLMLENPILVAPSGRYVCVCAQVCMHVYHCGIGGLGTIYICMLIERTSVPYLYNKHTCPTLYHLQYSLIILRVEINLNLHAVDKFSKILH